MARRSHAEKQMQAVGAKADAWLEEEFPGAKEVLHSWTAGELIIDFKDAEDNWRRMVWVPEDDSEIAGVRELA